MTKIKNAIIIHGPGKSGTTLINNILGTHKDLYWISTYLNKFPKIPALSLFNGLTQNNLIGEKIRRLDKSPKPAEAYNFWSTYLKDFRFNDSKFSKTDIQNTAKVINKIKHFQNRNRFLTKITGPSRYNFIDELFEEPYIVWLDRDPRAIISSYFTSNWRYKNSNSPSGKSRKEVIKEYVEYYKWLHIEKECLKEFNFRLFNYEHLVNEPKEFFEDLCEFLKLERDNSFFQSIEDWKLDRSKNEKFRKVFSKKELMYIEELLK
ncbi:hypothetical protein GCM10023115_25630 [Pontixanthobacter gangjinensis]|uniref:Sulfotransferase n=1 Tax=Christiangramia aestuarii TaxID=1028746 RepID=A0A7K1LM36_9FLAO|nr:sulfotransferase [Christiangramia aestuarii]MUP41798.1 sulfotransferase [Christiangramia aestuarii]